MCSGSFSAGSWSVAAAPRDSPRGAETTVPTGRGVDLSARDYPASAVGVWGGC